MTTRISSNSLHNRLEAPGPVDIEHGGERKVGYRGSRLRRWRELHGISSRELARQLSVSQPAVVQREARDYVTVAYGERYLRGVETIIRRRESIVQRALEDVEDDDSFWDQAR